MHLQGEMNINYDMMRILDKLEWLQVTFFVEMCDFCKKKKEVTILAPVITQQVRQCIMNSIVSVFLIPVDGHSVELSNYIKECSLEDILDQR